MILGALSALFRREQIPIHENELETLERDGPRSVNYLLSRWLKRTRRRFLSVLGTLVFLLFGKFVLHWSGAGLLVFVVYGAALSVLIDALRYGLAARWVFYSHSRAYRTEEVMIICRSVESGSQRRPAPRPRPQVELTLLIAGLCSLVGLPIVGVTLYKLGWAGWDTIFGNWLLPLSMIVFGAWRIGRAVQEIRYARAATVGSRELCLDSDDALDTYVATLVLSLPFMALGSNGATWVAFLVVAVRLAWFAHLWWWQRQTLSILAARVRRTHPHARATPSEWDDGDGVDASDGDL